MMLSVITFQLCLLATALVVHPTWAFVIPSQVSIAKSSSRPQLSMSLNMEGGEEGPILNKYSR